MKKFKISSENNRILIIPDVHYRFNIVTKILKNEQYDSVVFLGDFFDQFHDTSDDIYCAGNQLKNIWLWLKQNNKQVYTLWGNHDLSYAYGFTNQYTYCDGWSREKNIRLNEVFFNNDWDNFQWFLFVDDDILITHAGLNESFIKDEWDNYTIYDFLLKESKSANDHLICGNPHWMYMISFQYYGGILWNRPNHYDFIFNKIKNLKQIFGHTIHEHPWIEDENYCIDTNSQHYGIIENKKITICETSKIK